MNSCSGGGLGRGGYRVAPLWSLDVVEKGAAPVNTLVLLLLLLLLLQLLPAIVRLRRPWLVRAKPAGARGFNHHIA